MNANGIKTNRSVFLGEKYRMKYFVDEDNMEDDKELIFVEENEYGSCSFCGNCSRDSMCVKRGNDDMFCICESCASDLICQIVKLKI
jgi:hypothetical protein